MVQDGRGRRPLQRALMAAGAAVDRINFAEYVKVDDTTPDTPIDYTDLTGGASEAGDILKSDDGLGSTQEQKIVLKWASQLTGIVEADSVLVLGCGFGDLRFRATRTAGAVFISGNVKAHVRYITEDFTASTLTWNILAGLTKTGDDDAVQIFSTSYPKATNFVYQASAEVCGAYPPAGVDDSYGVEISIEASSGLLAAHDSYMVTFDNITFSQKLSFITWKN